jgi:hypothetical protein
LEALAATRNIEVIINFPLAMAINRLIGRSGDVIAKSKSISVSAQQSGSI